MRVLSVEPAGTADVFNMEVERTHDYVIQSGVVAHNCADEIRYMCMRSPITPPIIMHKPPKPFDPLDISDNFNAPSAREQFFLNI